MLTKGVGRKAGLGLLQLYFLPFALEPTFCFVAAVYIARSGFLGCRWLFSILKDQASKERPH